MQHPCCCAKERVRKLKETTFKKCFSAVMSPEQIGVKKKLTRCFYKRNSFFQRIKAKKGREMKWHQKKFEGLTIICALPSTVEQNFNFDDQYVTVSYLS